MYLNVYVCDEMNATTTHTSIVKNMKMYSHPHHDKPEVDRIQQWNANLIGKFMETLKVDKGRLRELSWANRHMPHKLGAGNGSQVHAKSPQDHKAGEVRCGLVATQLAIGETGRHTKCTTTGCGKGLVGCASLQVDENDDQLDQPIGLGVDR